MIQKGKWILGGWEYRKVGKNILPVWTKDSGDYVYACSVCGNEAYTDTDYGQQLFRYCQNCGARMIDFEERESDDETYKKHIRSTLGVRRKGVEK